MTIPTWTTEDGKRREQEERAAEYIRGYRSERGEWPKIRQICSYASVGTGTAHRALLTCKRTESE